MMLYEAKTIKDYKLHSQNGEIGKVKEFYFDDRHWTIRYLVADTGNWLTGRKVLISPRALIAVNKEQKDIVINLTKEQIEESPSLDSDKPVSRQFEADYHIYYGWPLYNTGSYMWGDTPFLALGDGWKNDPNKPHKTWDPDLFSTDDVIGYKTEALDGSVGCVEDFIIDDKTWAIRYLIIDTQDWWPGKRILVAPQWIKSVNWGDSTIFLNLARDPFKQLPEYSMESMLTREYETILHQGFNRQGYWVEEQNSKK